MTSKQLPNVSGQSEIRLMLGCRAGRWEDAKAASPPRCWIASGITHIFFPSCLASSVLFTLEHRPPW